MNPRQPADTIRWTAEELDALDWRKRHYWRYRYSAAEYFAHVDCCNAADARDGNLMLLAQRHKFVGNICTSTGNPLDWQFDVVVRLGMVRVYFP